MKSLITVSTFSAHARELRSYFDKQFADPRALSSSRFAWDYWHIPNQYTLLRTPAYEYFPKSTYMKIHKDLVNWGRKHLGCWDISPPWLSCYVEGCEQKLHSDVPHGPWAFVYSISPKKPLYQGGETLLLNEGVLNYWQNPDGRGDNEFLGLMDVVPAHYNQLTVFDPRRPHGVSRVNGTQDPREGRLVIHGWFSNPKTYIEGHLPPQKTEKILNEGFEKVVDAMGEQSLWGTLSIGLNISAAGQVTRSKFHSQTVRDQFGQEPHRFLKEILKIYSELKFPRTRGPSTATIPLIFSP